MRNLLNWLFSEEVLHIVLFIIALSIFFMWRKII